MGYNRGSTKKFDSSGNASDSYSGDSCSNLGPSEGFIVLLSCSRLLLGQYLKSPGHAVCFHVISNLLLTTIQSASLCGLVVRVPGYRSRGPGFYSRRYQIFSGVVGLERGPLSLVRIIEELLERK
jgi:hypothetical protein